MEIEPKDEMLILCFFALIALIFIYGVIWFGYQWWKRSVKGSIFPKVREEDIYFRENFASGRSYKSWMTKANYGINCVKLIVTPKELWITSWFPCTLFLDLGDMEHRIPKESILHIISRSRSVRERFFSFSYIVPGKTVHFVTFYIGKDETRTIELLSRHPEAFEEALRKLGVVARHENLKKMAEA